MKIIITLVILYIVYQIGTGLLVFFLLRKNESSIPIIGSLGLANVSSSLPASQPAAASPLTASDWDPYNGQDYSPNLWVG